MKVLIIWFLNLFDYIMTAQAIDKYSLSIERNPVFRYLMVNPGVAFATKIGVCSVACILCYALKDKPVIKFFTLFLLIFYALIALNHILIILV